jgi:hypothetical protein
MGFLDKLNIADFLEVERASYNSFSQVHPCITLNFPLIVPWVVSHSERLWAYSVRSFPNIYISLQWSGSHFFWLRRDVGFFPSLQQSLMYLAKSVFSNSLLVSWVVFKISVYFPAFNPKIASTVATHFVLWIKTSHSWMSVHWGDREWLRMQLWEHRRSKEWVSVLIADLTFTHGLNQPLNIAMSVAIQTDSDRDYDSSFLHVRIFLWLKLN